MPAYREAGITQQLVDNLGGIDYPTAKLQILLLLEEDDHATIEAFRATAAPDHVHMVLIPTWLQVLNAAVFFVAFGSMIVMHALAGRARERRLALHAPLLPLYWLIHSYAAWRGLWHLLVKPDLWEKTPHGLVPVDVDGHSVRRADRIATAAAVMPEG